MEVLEKLIALAQGKGFGAFSVRHEVKHVARRMISRPLLAIDIGGNIGDYTHALVTKFPGLEVHVFEPSHSNAAHLHRRFSDHGNVHIVARAVADATGAALLYSDKDGSGLASLTKRNLDHFGIRFEHQETIATIRFEEYWRQVLRSRELDLVKIDVEGHELDVLSGFGDAIAHTRLIQFEFGGCNIDTRTYFRDFWDFFAMNSFSLFRLTPFGAVALRAYSEIDEAFRTTNYFAVRRCCSGV